MTIQYTEENGFYRLLLRWKGSIWRLIGVRMLIFLIIYTALCVVVHHVPRDVQQWIINVGQYFRQAQERIPLDILVGFYVDLVMSRWWENFFIIALPDTVMYWTATFFPGNDDETRLLRRTVVRYLNCSNVLTWKKVSERIAKRFNDYERMLEAGLFTEKEYKLFMEFDNKGQFPYENYFIPLLWASKLFKKRCDAGQITRLQLDRLNRQLNIYRSKNDDVLFYDWVNVPLVYVQVATVAVYGYFVCAVLGRLPSDSYKQYSYNATFNATEETEFLFYMGWMAVAEEMCHPLLQTPFQGIFNIYVPIVTFLEFLFYMGWMAVAEEMCHPFGEDDEDFELNWIMDRNTFLGYLFADQKYEQISHKNDVLSAKKVMLPHTKVSWKIEENIPTGHLEHIVIEPGDEELDFDGLEEKLRKEREEAKTTQLRKRNG